MKRSLTLAIVLCLIAFAADNAAVTPREAASLKLQATSCGADAITIPQMLSYQGKLTDTLGQPVPNGNYQLTSRLYTGPSGGSPFWTEVQTILVRSGLFSALLGAVTPIGSVPDAGALYLSLQVAADPELSPRLRIASAAYAFLTARAANADLLQGKDTTAFDSRYVNEGQASSVTSNMMVDGTIAAADLGQMGAASGQVMKWNGSAWVPSNDSVSSGGGGGTVTSVGQATGVVCNPNPITATGTVGFDQTYGDGRYVNVAGDSVTGALAVQGDLRVYGKGRVGPGNANAGTAAFVVGSGNSASGNYSTIGGGSGDTASALYGGVPSGYSNLAGDAVEDTATVIAGGWNNSATGKFNFIGGGYQNAGSNNYSTIAGGRGNTANGPQATVGGGWGNVASGWHSAIAGGLDNVASGTAATVCGGEDNGASGYWSTVSGGRYDSAKAYYSTVGGGYSNVAGDTAAVVAGGKDNAAAGMLSAVVGGYADTASGVYSTVGGGFVNCATGVGATVAGGSANRASSDGAAVAGGSHNCASQTYAFAGGGYADTASGTYSTVGGGRSNIASGDGATVPGGYYCAASGGHSFAAGSYARARGRGTFVWSDSCTAADSVCETENNNWVVRARGGVYFFTNLAMTTGMFLAGGASEWMPVTADMTKDDLRPVDGKALLERLARMRVREFNLKGQDPSIRHIGPVAQDFHNAFGYGETEPGINRGDADGVLLAAVQALYDEMKADKARIAQLEAELARVTK